jgi:hypothetical protein
VIGAVFGRCAHLLDGSIRLSGFDDIPPAIESIDGSHFIHRDGFPMLHRRVSFERVVARPAPVTSLVRCGFPKQLPRPSFRSTTAGAPHVVGNGALIHLMQDDGFLPVTRLIRFGPAVAVPRRGWQPEPYLLPDTTIESQWGTDR